MNSRYYVLRSPPTDTEFYTVFEAGLAHLRQEHALDFWYEHHEELAENLGRHIYSEIDEKARLRLVEDFENSVRYLIVEAPTKNDAEQIGAWVAPHLPFIPLNELQEVARSTMEHDPAALVRMALATAEDSDPVSLEILQRGMKSNNVQVRFSAAEAASLAPWPELIPPLEKLKEKDPSKEVREMAGEALKACRRRSPAQRDGKEHE